MSKSIFHGILGGSLVLMCTVGLPLLATQAQGPTTHGKASPPSGGHQQFPLDHPAFHFDLPANWTVDRGNEDQSMLICNVAGHGDIGLLFMGVPNIFSQEDFVRILPGLAQDQLEQQGISELNVVSQGNAQTNGLPYCFVITKGTLRKKTMSVTLIGLISAQGRGYLLEYALPSAEGPSHIKEFQKIIDSLTIVQ